MEEYKYPITEAPIGGFYCAGQYFVSRIDAENLQEKMEEAWHAGYSAASVRYLAPGSSI